MHFATEQLQIEPIILDEDKNKVNHPYRFAV